MGAPRLALIGAFPYPLPQGSQVYFEDQARALVRAGCDCTLFTYGRGRGAPPDDLRVVAAPRYAAPRRMRSGPSLAKPLADAALLGAFVAACRRERYDAVLAHNAEAGAIALAARRVAHVPVVYVVHTLLAVELSAYLPRWAARGAGRLGARIDHGLARGADALVVLARSAEHALREVARGPIALIPPGSSVEPPPSAAAIAGACRRHALERDGYVLYSGNLDAYQELELLDGAARRRSVSAPPIVVATHTAPTEAERCALGALHLVHVDEFAEMRALAFGARTLVLVRRREGGYPIKLLNYMETGHPIVAFEAVAEGLEHGASAWLLGENAGVEAIAAALDALDADPALRAHLGEGARARLASHHDPAVLARETLHFVEQVVRG
jgi:glycosyltransferase involved in cell wall biosynthesis